MFPNQGLFRVTMIISNLHSALKSEAEIENGNSIVSNRKVIIEMPVNLGVTHLAPTKRKVSLTKLQKIAIVSTSDKKREHCWF